MFNLFLTSSIALAASQNDFSYVDANGIRFAYLEEDTGPLALLLYGYPETARSWTKVQHRVVAPNMRGYTPTGLSRTGDHRVGSLGASGRCPLGHRLLSTNRGAGRDGRGDLEFPEQLAAI
jgi:pimeloyl-ACP methyl ester carboxylesterase